MSREHGSSCSWCNQQKLRDALDDAIMSSTEGLMLKQLDAEYKTPGQMLWSTVVSCYLLSFPCQESTSSSQSVLCLAQSQLGKARDPNFKVVEAEEGAVASPSCQAERMLHHMFNLVSTGIWSTTARKRRAHSFKSELQDYLDSALSALALVQQPWKRGSPAA